MSRSLCPERLAKLKVELSHKEPLRQTDFRLPDEVLGI
jgi:hypothetical protein